MLQARAVQEGRASAGGADIRRLQDHNQRTPHNVALTHGHVTMLPVSGVPQLKNGCPYQEAHPSVTCQQLWPHDLHMMLLALHSANERVRIVYDHTASCHLLQGHASHQAFYAIPTVGFE